MDTTQGTTTAGPAQARESRNTYRNGREHQNGGARPSEGRTAVLGLWVPQPAGWINANHRMHWAQKAKLTRAWREAAAVYARQAKLPKGLERVHITMEIRKPTAREYDAHNLMPTAKALVDGFVDYGLVPDDTNKHVVGPDMREGGKGLPGVLVKITGLVIDAY